MIQDVNDRLYQVGLRLHYTPKVLSFDPEALDVSKIKIMACGRKHYIIVTEDNDVLTWGDVFKEKSEVHTEGFSMHYGSELFEGEIKQLEAKYTIFGALIEQ